MPWPTKNQIVSSSTRSVQFFLLSYQHVRNYPFFFVLSFFCKTIASLLYLISLYTTTVVSLLCECLVCVSVLNMASAATGSATARRCVVRTGITKTITKLHDADTGAMCDEQKCFEIGAKLGALRDKHEQVLLLDAERLLTCTTDLEVENAMNEAEADN